MRGTHPRRTLATFGVAGAGLVLGHWLVYELGTPHAHARDALLRATGHGYLPYATQVALLAGALGLAGLFLVRLHRGEDRGSFAHDAAALTLAQVAAFVAMEVAERLASGASLHDLTHGPLLAIGLGVQIVVAVAGAVLLRLTDRAAEGADGLNAAARLLPERSASIALVEAAVAPTRPAARAVSSRAPPSPA